MIKIFTLNKNGKIELTEKELKQLLDNVYWEGYKDNKSSWTYSTPLTYPYYSNTRTTNQITLGSATNQTLGSTIPSNLTTLGSTIKEN